MNNLKPLLFRLFLYMIKVEAMCIYILGYSEFNFRKDE